jgi:uncharacterized membrane protein YfcA
VSNRVKINAALLIAAAICLYVFASTSSVDAPHHVLTGAAFLAFGYAVGAYGTMVGAGGGFLIVPALLLVYHATPAQAAGTGISVVFMNALSGTISYTQQKRVDYRAGITFAVACLPGAIAGAFMSKAFSGRTFNLLFGVVLIAISALLIWRPVREVVAADAADPAPRRWYHDRRMTDAEGHVFIYRYNWMLGAFISFFVGFLSSVLGIGGGIIHVPALVFVLGFPPHLATATSHFILAITAGAGAITHLSLGHVLLWPALFMAVGVVGGAQLGAIAGRRVHGTWLLRLLAIALVFVAFRLFLAK